MAQEWLRVPIGRDAGPWRTAATQRVVLAVVHTVASAGHVLDAVELLESDRRIQVVFTQAPDLFSNGVREHLRALGGVVIPWHQATQTDFDLVLAADCSGVHELHGPVVMLSHGVVNNKVAPAALGGPASGLVVGLGAPWLTWYGRLVPAAVAVSHRQVIPVLAQQCPQAVPVAIVTGDLCLDRLSASAPHRDAYRRALGVPERHMVVAVSSTWGPDSLLGRSWRMLFDLLHQLPESTYSVRVTMHPAAWFGHGPRQVMGWLRQHRRAGLRLVEPTSWRGLVTAADVLIGDHGSATTYAAAIGVPVLRSPTPPGSTAPGSATELLARTAPALAPDRPLSAQLDAAILAARRHPNAPVAAAISSEPGRAAGLLRAHLYRLAALSEPTGGCAAAPVGPPVLVDE
ncbi:hypothetical protein OG792_19170 [Micromonospora sp. NBC_01699]|uniref:hypothetical protein n=1 Tax=Micromonospora sp. NBC_01699 TaxID=2975984 RepID=UPI002E2BD989|nr:hypothetical protein [Micromonospora sp. NBC_01699]